MADGHWWSIVIADVAFAEVDRLEAAVVKVLDQQELLSWFQPPPTTGIPSILGERLDGALVWSTCSRMPVIASGLGALLERTAALLEAATGCSVDLVGHFDHVAREHAAEDHPTEIDGIVSFAMHTGNVSLIHGGLDTTAPWVERLLARWSTFDRWEHWAILAELAFRNGRAGQTLPAPFWTRALDVPGPGPGRDPLAPQLRELLPIFAAVALTRAPDTMIRELQRLAEPERRAVIERVRQGDRSLLDPLLPTIDALLASRPGVLAMMAADEVPYAVFDLLARAGLDADLRQLAGQLRARRAVLKVSYLAAVLDDAELQSWAARASRSSLGVDWEPLVFLPLGRLRAEADDLLTDPDPDVRALVCACIAMTVDDPVGARAFAIRALDEVSAEADDPRSFAIAADLAVLCHIHSIGDAAAWRVRIVRPSPRGVADVAVEASVLRTASLLRAKGSPIELPPDGPIGDAIILEAARANAASLLARTDHPVPQLLALRCAVEAHTDPVGVPAETLAEAYNDGLISRRDAEAPLALELTLAYRDGRATRDEIRALVSTYRPRDVSRILTRPPLPPLFTGEPPPMRDDRQSLRAVLTAIAGMRLPAQRAHAASAFAALEEVVRQSKTRLVQRLTQNAQWRCDCALVVGILGDLPTARARLRELTAKDRGATRVSLLELVWDPGLLAEIIETVADDTELVALLDLLTSRMTRDQDKTRARIRAAVDD